MQGNYATYVYIPGIVWVLWSLTRLHVILVLRLGPAQSMSLLRLHPGFKRSSSRYVAALPISHAGSVSQLLPAALLGQHHHRSPFQLHAAHQ